MRHYKGLLISCTLREPAQPQNTLNSPKKDMPWQMLAPPNNSLAGPAFPTEHPPFSHRAWEIRLPGIQRKGKTTELPETLDWTKPGAHHPQQGGVLENTTFVKPEREDNTEPGMRNEICTYLGPHPVLSSHCTSCLCIQGALDPVQNKMQGNKCSPGNPTEGREEQRGTHTHTHTPSPG